MPPGKDEVPARLGPGGERFEKPGLADPRFACHLDRARAALVQLVQDPLERTKLVGTPNEVLGSLCHVPFS
jgi:hypothetical protein